MEIVELSDEEEDEDAAHDRMVSQLESVLAQLKECLVGSMIMFDMLPLRPSPLFFDYWDTGPRSVKGGSVS